MTDFRLKEDRHETENKCVRFPVPLIEKIEKFIGKDYNDDIEQKIINIIKKYDCKILETNSRKASHTRNMIDKTFNFTKNGHSTSAYI